MPIHMAPPIRALEEFAETATVIAAQDSQAVTILKAQEGANPVQRAKQVPNFFTRIWRGTVYTAT